MAENESASEHGKRPGPGRRALRWALELLLLLAAFLAINAWQTGDLPHGEMPRFALRELDGARFDSAALMGKPTLLLFWAPWCGVCRAQSQNVSWVQGIAGGGVRVISVATSYRTVAEVRAYIAAHEVDYPVLLGDAAVARSFGVHAFPTAFFVDSRGEILRAAAGYTTTLGLLWRVLFMR